MPTARLRHGARVTSSARVSPTVGWLLAVAAVVTAFFLVGIVIHAVSPSPSGPALSSYATTPAGAAAWAELLRQDSHAVRQLRSPLSHSNLPGNATLVILARNSDQGTPSVGQLQGFLSRGGRVVLGGQEAAALAPSLHGDVVTVPDPTFLENRELGSAGNASRSLRLVGPTTRPVYFDETVHGYGPGTGLAALPERWWFAIGALAIALAAWALSRAVRLGGSDPLPAPAPSPRGAYIEAMAATLVRAASRDEIAREAARAREREHAFRGSL
jgi:Domain of unknown function (DUF4350)